MSRLANTIFRIASRSLRVSMRQIPLSFSKQVSSKTLPIFIFHAVEEEPKPYIKHLYECHTPTSFEQVLDEILRNFEPLEDLSPQGIANAGSNQFLVTFDDGLRSSYEIAAPILERKGIPAIHFLITDFLVGSSGSRVEEKFKASLLKSELETRSEGDVRDAASILARAGYSGAIGDALMAVQLSDVSLYDRVAARLDIDLDAYFLAEKPYITHAEALDLANRGFVLGAHSCDHPRYWEVDLEEQIAQTLGSMKRMAELLPIHHRYFAFPYKNRGITPAFYERTKDAVDLFFTTSGWGNRMNAQGVFHRVGMDSAASAVTALKCGWRPYPLCLIQ